MTVGELIDALVPLLLEGTVTRQALVVIETHETCPRPLGTVQVGVYDRRWWEFYEAGTREAELLLGKENAVPAINLWPKEVEP